MPSNGTQVVSLSPLTLRIETVKELSPLDAVGSFLIKRLISKRGGCVQEFEVRNDMSCGSTVGPFLSKLGVRTVDIGLAQLRCVFNDKYS